MPALEALTMDERETIFRYLLGQMSEPERQEFQDRLFSDDEFFDSVTELETDLIDAYARGELTPGERELMEQSLLVSPAAQKRVEFATALAGIVSSGASPVSSPRPARFGPRWLPIAAMVVLAAAVGALFFQNRDLRNRIETLQSEQAVGRQQTLAPSLPVVFSVLLLPGAVRGGEGVRQISIPASSQMVNLQLDLRGDQHESYRVILSTAGGNKVWELNSVVGQREAAGAVLPFWIPASLLSPGQYELTVTTGSNEPVEFYYFRVVPR